MIFNCHGGPLDGLEITVETEPRPNEWHPVNDRGGYRYDTTTQRFHWQWLIRVEHQAESGHTFIFVSTYRVKIHRYCGYLAQTLYSVWSTGIFGWRDAAAVAGELRERGRKVSNE